MSANLEHSAGQERPPIKIIGRSGSMVAYGIRDFLQRSDVPFEWLELKTDEEARKEAGATGLKDPILPVCIFPDGTRLLCPTIRQITERLGWFHDAALSEYDLAIYGAGPAGLSAAVYGASEGLKTIVIVRAAIGGQAGTSSKIENYLGFPLGISGADLAERAKEQAVRFGAEILLARAGVGAEFIPGKGGIGYLEDGSKILARAAICATGVEYRRLNLPGEPDFLGAGIYYGAGASEAALCGDEHVVVIGGGNSAGQAAINFSRFARKVSIVIRGASLKSTLSSYLIDKILAEPRIEVRAFTEVTALEGDDRLRAILLTNRETQQTEGIETQWLFACIGGDPRTEWAEPIGIARDAGGYLLTGPDLLLHGEHPPGWPVDRDPYYLETSMPGLFAAGDVRHGSIKRCASAVGEGAMSVAFVHRYLAGG